MQVTFGNESFKHAFQLERLFRVKYFEIIRPILITAKV